MSEFEKPTPPPEVPEDMRSSGRLFGGTFVLFAVIIVAMEYRSIQAVGNVAVQSIILGSFFGVMGPAALIQPGLLWSLSSRRNELPRGIRTFGFVLAGAIGVLMCGIYWSIKGGRLF